MTSNRPSYEFGDQRANVRAAWETNADFWDQRMGEGNEFHNELIGPTQEQLLAIEPGMRILDVACGNGQFARRMADLGANVVAVDLSERMIAHAVTRTREHRERIQFRVMDATEERALRSLGESSFDAAVCTMAVMDMAEIGPLASALSHVLKPGGIFVMSTMHPAFNSPEGITFILERIEAGTEFQEIRSVKVSRYLTPHSHQGTAMYGQPVTHPYFHRPVSVIVNTFSDNGFVVDRMDEPAFGDSPERQAAMNWTSYSDIPPALVVRFRLDGARE